jgi:ASC-1-like (ASCH) protein
MNSSKPLQNQNFSFKIDKEYFNYIKNGEKTVEGRILKDKYKDVKIENVIEFINRSKEEEKIFRKVTKIKTFDNFTEMINKIGVEKLLPNVSSKKEGVNIYHAFGNYKNEELIHKVVAFFLEKVD